MSARKSGPQEEAGARRRGPGGAAPRSASGLRARRRPRRPPDTRATDMRASAFARSRRCAPVADARAAACSGRTTRGPTVDAPATFRFAVQETTDIANTAWWEQFEDPGAERADRHCARGEQGRQDCRRARRTVPRAVRDDAFADCFRRWARASMRHASARRRMARCRCRRASAQSTTSSRPRSRRRGKSTCSARSAAKPKRRARTCSRAKRAVARRSLRWWPRWLRRTSICAASTGNWTSRRPRPRAAPIRSMCSRCASSTAKYRRWNLRRASPNIRPRSPRFRSSNCRSRQQEDALVGAAWAQS